MTESNVWNPCSERETSWKNEAWTFTFNTSQWHTHTHTHTHNHTKTSSQWHQLLLLVGGPLKSIWRHTITHAHTNTHRQTHTHTHTHTAETAGQTKPVSVKATSSFEDRGSLWSRVTRSVSQHYCELRRFTTSAAHFCFPTAALTLSAADSTDRQQIIADINAKNATF